MLTPRTALLVTFAAVALGLAVAVTASFALAAGQPTPSSALVAKGCAWVLLADAVVRIIAVGLASLTASRVVTLTALIGWEPVVSPQLVSAASLGSARNLLLDGALLRIEPQPLPNGTPHLSMTIGATIAVLAMWTLAATALATWRVANRDA